MSFTNYQQFLSERNEAFISKLSSESALGLYGHFMKAKKDIKKKFIVVSFDPPISYPPFALNGNEAEVVYLDSPKLEGDSYQQLAQALEDSEEQLVVIVEKDNPPHKRKILRWLKNLKENTLGSTKFSETCFVLAEYKAPLKAMKFSELKG